ncbi:RNA-binding, CRM domain containing protein [Parasponia andersonii]|uniref:RNA-binding, CRM domain containing protein n=1 Tax=Parasponia andersonii TaxID=3476 RepID=A0A2P5DPA7_PARAD|nr:RNA-binding, CRM domain containing protein [Parasponia andersonii]
MVKDPGSEYLYGNGRFLLDGQRWFHSASCLRMVDKVSVPTNHSDANASVDGNGNAKVKRKKLKGKRAVVRWLKFFRWKKKKEYHRMTAEEKVLYKLRKAQKKEARYVEALKKIEPTETSETTHDPEILTPEEHFFFLKMGLKCKNYVPVGRRGIYQGVILNMHLHWKKHQTLKVVVKTFTPEEVKEIATELARLTGGIVLDIHEENKIIMYRGKNYSQPPTEIMSPRVTLSRKKALDKSKYRDGLRSVRKYIPKLQQDLVLLQAQAKSKPASINDGVEETQETDTENTDFEIDSNFHSEKADKLKEIADGSNQCSEDDLVMKAALASDSEDLSDIFETDSEMETEKNAERPLFLEEFKKFPVKNYGEPENFEDHLRQISLDSKKAKSSVEEVDFQNFDEVDRLFLRAASRLKKSKR